MGGVISVDGVTLDVPGTRMVTNATRLHGPATVDVASVKLPGVDGEVPVPVTRTVGPGRLVMQILVEADTTEAMLRARAGLEALMMPPRRLITVREVTGNLDISAAGVVTKWDPRRVDETDTTSVIDVEVVIPAGVWREPGVPSNVAPGVGVKTVTGFVGGSAPQTGPTIQFTPTASPVVLQMRDPNDGGAWFRFSGPVTVGVPVVIDLEALTVVQGGTSLTGLLDIGARPMTVSPDGRVQVVASTGTGTLLITSRKAWY